METVRGLLGAGADAGKVMNGGASPLYVVGAGVCVGGFVATLGDVGVFRYSSSRVKFYPRVAALGGTERAGRRGPSLVG